MFRSLRLRMALSHAAVLLLILLALSGAGYVLLARSLDRSATADVLTTAREEVERLEEAGSLSPPPDTDVPAAAAVRVALFLPDGTVAGDAQNVPAWLRPRGDEVLTLAVGRDTVRVATLPVVLRGRPAATVVAGRSLELESRLLGRLRLLFGGAGLVAVLLSAAAGWLLSGRAVAPIRAAYEARASFAADASHELRTPLAFVRSAVEVLADTPDPQLGSDVLREVEYLTGLTDRLLTLTRADAGVLTVDLGPVALDELLRIVAERNRRTLGMRIEVRVEDGIAPLADPVALQAALDALLENASRHGGGSAELEARRRGNVVLTTVADHGPGLDPEARRRAFERFYRADAARAREDGGAGLGLALARSLVQAQGGRLWLEETPGGGLTALLELPAAAHYPDGDGREPDAPSRPGGAARAEPGRVRHG